MNETSGPSAAPTPSGTAWLDEVHVLEPVNGPDSGPVAPGTPLVEDVRGRLWRIRRGDSDLSPLLWQRFKALLGLD